MTAATFDFTPLWPAGLPAAAAKWTGLAKFSFVGGNNDPDQVPLEGLIEAVNAVLRREGKTLATYGLASGPQGYLPSHQFLSAKLKRDGRRNFDPSAPSCGGRHRRRLSSTKTAHK